MRIETRITLKGKRTDFYLRQFARRLFIRTLVEWICGYRFAIYVFRMINRGNSHMAFPRETLSFFSFIFCFQELYTSSLSRWEPRGIEGSNRPLELAFRKSKCSRFALSCLALSCFALPHQGASTSLDLPRATRVNAANGERAITICVSNGHPRAQALPNAD